MCDSILRGGRRYINSGTIILRKPQRTTFAFSYVVADVPISGINEIKGMVEEYRAGWDKDSCDKLLKIVAKIESYPHVVGYWR